MKTRKTYLILLSAIIIFCLFFLLQKISFSQAYTHCFVHIYENTNFDNGAAHLIVVGPIQSTSLELLPECGSKNDWSDAIDSIQVGPDAWVILFSDADYKGTNLFLSPNTTIRDLDGFGMGDDVSSMMIYDKNPYPNYQWLKGNL